MNRYVWKVITFVVLGGLFLMGISVLTWCVMAYRPRINFLRFFRFFRGLELFGAPALANNRKLLAL